MENSANSIAALETAAQPQSTSPAQEPDAPEQKTKAGRTPGLKLFDVFLYPLITNVAVFAISVAATYLTSKGGAKNAEGKLIYGKVGDFFYKRGEWVKGKLMGKGMSEGQADMAKMVTFSFLDGSLLAPVIKLFEDRREKIGRAIDKKLGHHAHDSAYEAEPKQSWLSVLGGRLATVSIVVPTAVALDKLGLNHVLFTKPGIKLGEYLASKPRIAKALGHMDIKEVGRISAFEAFYTSVCTAGVYISSRLFARAINKKQEKHDAPAPPPVAAPVPTETAPVSTSDEASPNFASTVKRSAMPDMPPETFAKRLDAEPDAAHSMA